MAEVAQLNTPERRQRFRTFMARLDGAADPRRAIEEGWYVDHPGGVAETIARRLELRPAATQLLVGGVGTGKTTQLLVARDRLIERLPEAIALYIDVSAHQALDRMQAGSLMALAGLKIAESFDSDNAKALRKSFREWAHGAWIDFMLEPPDASEYFPEHVVFRPGVVTPPEMNIADELKQHRDALKAFLTTEASGREVVVFLDSLDRVTDMAAFQITVEQDVAALSSVGVGVVLVGPLRAVYGLDRVISDRFDSFHRQAPVDTHDDEGFLVEVLRRRAERDLLPDEACRVLTLFSGGALRDLIRLASEAGEEAYLAGAERVELEHVRRAADAFGRSLMMGLSSEDIDKLCQIISSGTFVETSERDLARLVTRRVLDYGAGAEVRYEVHPTLLSLLPQVGS